MTQKSVEPNRSSRMGFTLLELLVVIVLIGILIGMLLPATRRVREPARRAQCMNNLRQLALATLNYESTHGSLPPAMGMPDWYEGTAGPDANRLSGLVHLLPFMEQQALYDSISQPSEHNGVEYAAFGAAPWDSSFPPWTTKTWALTCPSTTNSQSDTDFGWTSYAFSIGDQARGIHDSDATRGAFSVGASNSQQDISDGTSNTIAFTEMGTGDRANDVYSRYLANQPDSFLNQPDRVAKAHPVSERNQYLNPDQLAPLGRGRCWADGAAGVSLVNTILPPNSPSFAVGGEIAVDGVYSAGGFHNGGINVTFADGHIQFIDKDIDAGNSYAPTPTIEQMSQAGFSSPYGVWGAMGTASGAEVIDDGW